VFVFCRLGWYVASSETVRPSRTAWNSAPWAKTGLPANAKPCCASARTIALKPIAPKPTATRSRSSASNSSTRNEKQLRSSCGVGLFCGGAQRAAAVMKQSRSSNPSERSRATGADAKPARKSAG